MGTCICLFLTGKMGFGLLGMKDIKNGNGKTQMPYKDSWTFQIEITLRTATEQFIVENLSIKSSGKLNLTGLWLNDVVFLLL